MEISVVGISHHTAPVHIRERFSLPGEHARQLLGMIRTEGIFSEALVLDTCNRTEIYLVHREPVDCIRCVLGYMAKLGKIPQDDCTSAFYCHTGPDAVTHLFHVSASLDSQIIGEDQILAQVKRAYQAAVDEHTTGFVLNRLLHRAIRVGKRIAAETELKHGAASIPQAAVELARQTFCNLAGKSALLVGAGQTAELAARNLAGCGISRIVVANRTLSRAQQVAADLLQPVPHNANGENPPADAAACNRAPAEAASLATEAISLDGIPSVISTVNMVLCSTGSPDLVLTWENVGEIIRRCNRPIVIIDVAVPRDADPRLDSLSNVFLYNIDDLNQLVAANIERRRSEIPKAEAIIEHELRQFEKWLDSLLVAPIVKLLQQHFEQLRRAEIKRYGHQFSDADSEQLELFTRSLCSKILHKPLVFLQGVSRDDDGGESQAALDVIRRMFDLVPEDDKDIPAD